MKKRLDYVDRIKGFAALLVIISHMVAQHTFLSNEHPIREIICSFHMSLFFFISGYMTNKIDKIEQNGGRNFIVQRIRSLIMPYIFWLFISPIFVSGVFPSSLDVLLFYPNYYLWFLPLMFIFLVIYLVRHYVIKRIDIGLYGVVISTFIPIVLTAFAGFILNEYHLVIYSIYMFSFFFGDYMSKFAKFREYMTLDWVWGVAAVAFCVIVKISPLEVTSNIDSLLNLVFYFGSSFTGCIVFYNLFKKITLPNWLGSYLSFMGQCSLGLYLIPTFMIPYGLMLPDSLPVLSIAFILLAVAVVRSLIASGIYKIICEIPILRLIMFGRK